MNTFFRILLSAAGAWGLSVGISIALIGIAAAVTQKWSAGKMQPVVVILFVLMIAVFVTGVVFVHSAGKRILAGEGSPWPYTIVYSTGVAVTALVFGFITLVALNR